MSRKAQWATSSSSSSQQMADSNAGDNQRVASGCPLCAQEQQQQQAAAASAAGSAADSSTAAPSPPESAGSSSSSNPAGAACFIPGDPQQAWRDAFGWRRLVWGLLGRIKPSAQAWYVQQYGMCPHCPDGKLWNAVSRSLRRHLWVPPDADVMKWQLSGPYCPSSWREKQARMMLQYARALNAAFLVRVGAVMSGFD
jgi:hypothetical protein